MTKEKKPKVRRQKVYDLSLTKLELLHVRDLMSMLLPPNGEKTISQSLAELENRGLIETRLWGKVSSLCQEASLPLNDEAPDYIVAPNAPPPMSVFHINSDVSEPSAAPDGSFLRDDSEEDEEDEDEEEEG